MDAGSAHVGVKAWSVQIFREIAVAGHYWRDSIFKTTRGGSRSDFRSHFPEILGDLSRVASQEPHSVARADLARL